MPTQDVTSWINFCVVVRAINHDVTYKWIYMLWGEIVPAPPVQYYWGWRGLMVIRLLWLSGRALAVKPEVSWIRLLAAAYLLTFLYFRLITFISSKRQFSELLEWGNHSAWVLSWWREFPSQPLTPGGCWPFTIFYFRLITSKFILFPAEGKMLWARCKLWINFCVAVCGCY